jgi:hypothetical protein
MALRKYPLIYLKYTFLPCGLMDRVEKFANLHMNEPSDPRSEDKTIDLSGYFDRIYWRTRFATTDEELASAVRIAGPRVEDVREYFWRDRAAPRDSVAVSKS